MAHTSSDNPDVLRGIIEGLKKQVSCLAAANRRLQNEAKQNSRNKLARGGPIDTERSLNKILRSIYTF